MPRRRIRKRRSKTQRRAIRAGALFVGASVLMLALILVLLVPRALAQHISFGLSVGLSFLLWACCVFALIACWRSRRRRYTHGRARPTLYTDYSDAVKDHLESQAAEDAPAIGDPNTERVR